MRHGSLFSGIGGFDLASEWMGWDNVFNCEIEEFPRKILNYYFPNAISYEDIKSTDFTIHRGQIDILTGGFPCQPYSVAGKRKGKNDERHLWPEMLRAIREISPRWVVGENVRGLINWNGGLVFDEVQSDLEAEGYEVQAFILPAASVGAPHRRDRVWFVAYNYKRNRSQERLQARGEINVYGTKERRDTSDTDHDRHKARRKENGIQKEHWTEVGGWKFDGACISPDASDTESEGSRKFTQKDRGWEDRRFNDNGKEGDVADTDGRRQPNKEHRQAESRWTTKKGFSNNWQNFPTQSPLCGGDDGLSSELDGITFPRWRNESIKGYGNAVVPQVVYQIFKAIQEYENTREI